MLHGFNFLKLVLLSTLNFTYSNASNSHILQSQEPEPSSGNFSIGGALRFWGAFDILKIDKLH